MMREKIKNALKITCSGVDLTTVRNIEFYVKQRKFFGCYTPIVVSASEMLVTIPFSDAKKLTKGTAELQFAFTNAEGVPDASDVEKVEVAEFLKEVGYEPK